MQQIAGTQICLTPSTSFLNRALIKQKLSTLLQTLSQYSQQLALTDDKSIELFKHDLTKQLETLEHDARSLNQANIQSMMKQLADQVKKFDSDSHKFVIDPVLKPVLEPSFFENRHGFKYADLINCQFGTQTLLKREKSLYLSQTRGFKTKRQTDHEDQDDRLFSWRSSSKKSEDPFKSLENLLSQPTFKSNKTKSKSTSLGSIFDDKKPDDLAKLKLGNNELDNKIKSAFVEGFLYKQTKDDKTSQRRSNTLSLIRFITFMVIIFILYNSISISTVSNGNGRNSAGNGINIRALTGNVNFEINPETVSIRFEDVKGLPEAKKELTDIVDFLKDPERYTKLGARLPKGILLVGPPGCGKTLLAKSVAGEAGVPFFQASGSDFDEMFVGTGSKRVRQLFAAARAKAPCVIFIDEIDSVGSTRTNSMIHPHANQTINQLLAEMDGFQKNEGVIVLGATNRRDTLDSALLRPGRFDVEVRIDKPDFKARKDILEFYLEKVARDPNVDVEFLARQLAGFGGSSIENIVNQAALRAAVTSSHTVAMEHLEWALDRTLLGYGKSRLADEECNKNTAYHEAGHVLVAYFTKDSDPLHKVTILPRSQSLGHTAFVPENDGYSMTRSQLLAKMDVSMGGRVAEELVFGQDKVTTGAMSDFKSATSIATQMVKMLGMSEKIGPRVFDDENKTSLSSSTQELLDQEIKKMLHESYDRAKNILKNHSVELKLIADALMTHETLDVDQIKSLIEKHKL
ncbi:ATP-dependent zinc metalloprotease YME1 -like protein [Brachionus plicatilis]|uniref:ATP-dependent zinc metalloprotease YME1-like protein n=1 Tax=Brachionus plicatilis TaxID=10195 RepID=A0A3M7QW65_BRAPC|nr:ATP-dependent zinc metalloprotease YME1 -like protein [Brachionus plicatilis]